MPKGIYKRKKLSEERKIQCIKNLKGRMKGKHHTEKAKEKMRLAALGHKGYWLGRKHKSETIEKMRLANIGEKNPMFGKKISIEHNKKIHKSGVDNYFYGKHHTIETKKIISKANKGRLVGEKNPSWKGGIKSLASMIRELDEYAQWRTNIFQKDDFSCIICKDNTSGNLEAHHKKEFYLIFQEFLKTYSQFSPIDDKETLVRLATAYEPFWNLNNGGTLCKKCHNLTRKDILHLINLYINNDP